MMKQTQ